MEDLEKAHVVSPAVVAELLDVELIPGTEVMRDIEGFRLAHGEHDNM